MREVAAAACVCDCACTAAVRVNAAVPEAAASQTPLQTSGCRMQIASKESFKSSDRLL